MKKQTSLRTIKAWAVFWEEKAAREYGVNPNDIIPLEPVEKFKVRCRCHCKKGKKTGWHSVDALAVFVTKAEAKGGTENNKEWKIVPIEIIIIQPAKIK